MLQGIPFTSQWYSWLKTPSVLINAWTVFSHTVQNLRIATESWRRTLTVHWVTCEHIQQLSEGPNTIKSQGRIDFFFSPPINHSLLFLNGTSLFYL